jgi:branched-chain amino acid transport system substrate-binding protein
MSLGLATAGCSGSTSSGTDAPASSSISGAPTGTPIKIGYLASLTGFCSAFSEDYVKGAKLAVQQINQAGGVLGRPLAIDVRDDQATPNVGVQQARDLVLNGGAKFLAGTCSSAVGQSVEKLVANPSHVPYVAGVVDSTIFKDAKGSYIFGTLPSSGAEGQAVAEVVKGEGVKTVALLGEDYSYGHQVFAAFKSALAGSGIKIVSEDYVTPGAADYSAYANKIMGENPDIVYNNLLTDDAVTFTKQAVPLGYFDKVKQIGIQDYATMQAMSKVPVGAGGYTYYPSASIYDTAMAKQLAPLGNEVANGGAAGDGYNQIEMLAEGITAANSTDGPAVQAALEGAKLRLIQGDFTMNPCSHLAGMPIALGTVAAQTNKLPFPHLDGVKILSTPSGPSTC